MRRSESSKPIQAQVCSKHNLTRSTIHPPKPQEFTAPCDVNGSIMPDKSRVEFGLQPGEVDCGGTGGLTVHLRTNRVDRSG